MALCLVHIALAGETTLSSIRIFGDRGSEIASTIGQVQLLHVEGARFIRQVSGLKVGMHVMVETGTGWVPGVYRVEEME